MASVELATGYVQLVPSAKGIEGAIASELGGPAGVAGQKAGGLFGSGFSKAAAATGAVGVAAFTKGVFDFTGFERQMNEVFTLIPDAGQDTFDKLTKQSKDFAKEFGVLPDKVVPALYQAISAGVPTDNVFAFLETAQKAAKGGVTELSTAVDGITSVVNAYGADVLSASDASDAMFTAVKGGKTTFDELSNSLFNVIPTASSIGLEFGNVTAALATMTAAGTPTSVATTQLRQVLVELTKDGSKTSKMFEELSGSSFKQFVADGGNLQNALEILGDAAYESGLGINDLFGSVEAGSAALSLTGANAEKFFNELKNADDAAGATQRAFEQMEQGIGPVIDKLKAEFAVALIDLGDAAAPAVKALGKTVLGLIKIFTALPAPLRTGLLGVITLTAGVAAFAGPAKKMITAVSGVGKAFTLLASNPWILVAAAAIALAILVVKNWDEIKATLVAAWQFIQTKGAEIWNAIKQFFVDYWPVLLAVFAGPIGLIAGLIIQNWDAIWAKTQEIWAAVSGFIGARVADITGFFGTLVGAGAAIVSFFTGLPAVVSGAWEAVKQFTADAVAFLKAKLDELFAAADRALGPLDEIVGKGFSLAGGAASVAKGLFGFDAGGTVPGRRGEPRLILAHGGETVLPTHRAPFADVMSTVGSGPPGASGPGGSGGGVHNDFRGLTVRDDADLRSILRAVDRSRAAKGVPVGQGLRV
jgi:TP901 family phage tail tape measure protein